MDQQNQHFDKIYWFIVGICIFGAFLTVFLIIKMPPVVAERIADTALMFWLSTAVAGGIGYLIGSSLNKSKQAATPGQAEINITASTEAKPETPE